MALPTKLPAYSALHRSSVYQPSEDSFLMMDAIDLVAEELRTNVLTNLIIECGVGSGIVSAHLCAKFPNAQIIAVDINSKATEAAKDTLHQLNHVEGRSTVARMNFLNNIHAKGLCDLIVYNPPYVPDECYQGKKDPIDLAWNGGLDGVESTHPLVEMIGDLLTPTTGRLLLLLEHQNKIPEFLERYSAAFDICKMIHRKVPGELLYVYCFRRKAALRLSR